MFQWSYLTSLVCGQFQRDILCEIFQRLFGTWGVSIWDCVGVGSSLGKFDMDNSILATNCCSSLTVTEPTVFIYF